MARDALQQDDFLLIMISTLRDNPRLRSTSFHVTFDPVSLFNIGLSRAPRFQEQWPLRTLGD